MLKYVLSTALNVEGYCMNPGDIIDYLNGKPIHSQEATLIAGTANAYCTYLGDVLFKYYSNGNMDVEGLSELLISIYKSMSNCMLCVGKENIYGVFNKVSSSKDSVVDMLRRYPVDLSYYDSAKDSLINIAIWLISAKPFDKCAQAISLTFVNVIASHLNCCINIKSFEVDEYRFKRDEYMARGTKESYLEFYNFLEKCWCMKKDK